VCRRERRGERERERQLAGALFGRTVLSPARLSSVVIGSHPGAAVIFQDACLVEFLDRPASHPEADADLSVFPVAPLLDQVQSSWKIKDVIFATYVESTRSKSLAVLYRRHGQETHDPETHLAQSRRIDL
jgi:hypothetical protein